MLGALGGPTLGGFLLQHFWWGSVFLLNVPIAALGILAAVAIIPESRGPASRPDLVGALLSMIGMTSLVWGVIAAAKDGWSSGSTVGGFGLAVVALVGFAVWERRCPEPMLPIALFRNRNFSGASLSIVLLSFAGGGVMLALTQYLQFVLGFSPLRAGLAFGPLIVAAMVFNGVGVVVDKKLGARAAVAIGLGLLAVGFGLLATTSSGDGYGRLVFALVVIGMGSGTAGPAAYGTLLGALPPERAGVGSAVNDTTRELGGTLGVAIVGRVFASIYSSRLSDSAMIASLPEQVRATMERSMAAAQQVVAQLPRPVIPDVRAAVDTAFLDGMQIGSLVSAGIALGAAIVVAWLLPARARQSTPEPEAVSA